MSTTSLAHRAPPHPDAPARQATAAASWARERAVLLICLAALIVIQAYACAMDIPRILDHLTIDDTFLYLQVARNVSHGQGPTFDGIHLTNGFQPLWLMLTVPFGWVFRSPDSFIRACLALCGILNVASAVALYRLGVILGGRAVASTAVVGWVWMVTRWKPLLSGMETNLYVFIFLMFVLHLQRSRVTGGRLSALGGYLVLCRVDALVYAVAGVMALRPRTVKALCGMVLPGLLLVAPYLAWNQYAFGSPMPISGRVKALYYRLELGERYLTVAHLVDGCTVRLPHAIASTSSIYTAPLEGLVNRRVIAQATPWACLAAFLALFVGRERRWRLLAVLALAGALHMLVFALTIGQFASLAWYYGPFMVLVLLGFSRAFSALAHRAGCAPAWIGHAVLVAAVAVATRAGAMTLQIPADPDSLYQWRYRVARWMASNLDRSAIVGSWNAGHLAYFSGRPVVNLDGLVNDQAYFEVLRSESDVLPYIRKEGITHIVDYDDVGLRRPGPKGRERGRWFRGEIPMRLLDIIYTHPPHGKDAYQIKVMRVLKKKPPLPIQARAASSADG